MRTFWDDRLKTLNNWMAKGDFVQARNTITSYFSEHAEFIGLDALKYSEEVLRIWRILDKEKLEDKVSCCKCGFETTKRKAVKHFYYNKEKELFYSRCKLCTKVQRDALLHSKKGRIVDREAYEQKEIEKIIEQRRKESFDTQDGRLNQDLNDRQYFAPTIQNAPKAEPISDEERQKLIAQIFGEEPIKEQNEPSDFI